MNGYLHAQYATSFAEFGTPRELPRCGGHILVREIEDFPARDGMGCYPLFACEDWSQLPDDVAALKNDLVSLAVVTDPFGNYDEPLLHHAFPDLVQPYKAHFVTKLGQPRSEIVSKHHRYYSRRASEDVTVHVCQEPMAWLDEWVSLYDYLKERHGITGIQAFSRASFAQQFKVPGLVMVRAAAGEETVGMHLWFRHENIVYSHLAASNQRGYDLMASYAIHWHAIDFFANDARWLHLGAGAGVKGDEQDGLSRFKRGWATSTRTAYFCGRIFDRERYDEIARARGIPATSYFPAYRLGEFGE